MYVEDIDDHYHLLLEMKKNVELYFCVTDVEFWSSFNYY